MPSIRPRERNAIIQSLRAGVTPRTGLEHIQVGRVNEIKALIGDLDNICQGGSAFRLVIGDFGAGKSFFLQLIRYIALQKNMVLKCHFFVVQKPQTTLRQQLTSSMKF